MRDVLEKQWQEQVIQLAHLYGWHVAHFRTVQVRRKDGSMFHTTPVVANGKGFPDLVLVRERVIYAELKREKGRLSPAQEEWVQKLTDAGAEVHIWRPSDWDLALTTLQR